MDTAVSSEMFVTSYQATRYVPEGGNIQLTLQQSRVRIGRLPQVTAVSTTERGAARTRTEGLTAPPLHRQMRARSIHWFRDPRDCRVPLSK